MNTKLPITSFFQMNFSVLCLIRLLGAGYSGSFLIVSLKALNSLEILALYLFDCFLIVFQIKFGAGRGTRTRQPSRYKGAALANWSYSGVKSLIFGTEGTPKILLYAFLKPLSDKP